MNERDAWTQHVKQLTVKVRVPVNKYHAQRVTVDGITFDSKKEARRYGELKLLQAAGKIQQLELQPRFPIQVAALYKSGPPWEIAHCGEYRADFRYTNIDTGELTIEDIKSPATRTPLYVLKKKLVEAIWGVTIVEVE